MALKQLELAALVDVPAAHGEVGAAGEERLAVRVHRHAGHGALVALQRLQLLPALEVPGACREVGGAGDEQVLGGVQVSVLQVVLVRRHEDERVDAALVSPEHPDALAAVEVPAARGAVVGGGEDVVAGADHPVHHAGVSHQHGQTLARAHVPLAHRLVRAAGQHEAVFDDDAVDVLGVSAQDADTLAQLRLRGPHPGRLVLAARGQHRAVLAQSHAVDARLVLLQGLHQVAPLVLLRPAPAHRGWLVSLSHTNGDRLSVGSIVLKVVAGLLLEERC